MRVLFEEPYFYTVLRDDESGKYFLEIVFGRSAINLFRIKLRQNEIEKFIADKSSIEPLVYRIMDAPDSFLRRKI